ncbi:hypothetical protein [uncultured Algimonas sp.]|uniref:hypothetical protein n=1 Tax=uncultured Algimonas sp. TaxID=1547920 RepID=UPI002623AC88|nr:hypothetical protein [uncultured Algimonas sp.]
MASFALASCTTSYDRATPGSLSWPAYGPDTGVLRVDAGLDRNDGLTNAVPDIVGPVDGSAALTIFTEGNHYPVLLPLLLEAFPAHCADTGLCDVTAEDILVVTLPQVMIVAGLERGGAFASATPSCPSVLTVPSIPIC